MKLDRQRTPYTRINSKWIKHLNMSRDTIKVLEKNIGGNVSNIPHSNIFANISPGAREIKEKINKWYYVKQKSLYMAKETIIKMKREPTVWGNIYASDTSDKGLSSKTCEKLIWLNTRKTNNPIKKWAKDI